MKLGTKIIRLVHNANAGTTDGDGKDKLEKLIEANGYLCEHAPSKNRPVKALNPHTDLIAIAGGDGTIRSTIIELLDKKLKFKRPIALLPLGTANNIASSLGIGKNLEAQIRNWKKGNYKKFDVGQVIGLGKRTGYFLESFGLGLFPQLMLGMSEIESGLRSPSDEFRKALAMLSKLARESEGFKVKLSIAGKMVEKKCLMLEVMNIGRLGPKLQLAGNADPGDGQFNVVMVEVSQRKVLLDYLKNVKLGGKKPFPLKSLKTQRLVLKSKLGAFHIDDELVISKSKSKLKISLLDSLLEMVV